MKKSSFIPLFATNFAGVFNDNFLKTLAMFIVCEWITGPKLQSTCLGLTAGALVLPYIFCSPFAARMMQYHSKTGIVRAAKWAELPIVGIGIAGFLLHSIALVVSGVFLMGLQSSLFSPAKYALVRDIGGEERVSVGLGWMDGLSFFAMLAGTVAASFLIRRAPEAAYSAILLFFAASGVIASYAISAQEEREFVPHSVDPLRFFISVYRQNRQYRDLNKIIFFSGIFWLVAAMMQMGLLLYGTSVLKISAFQTGLVLSLAAVGIATGNIAAGAIDRKIRLLKILPLSGCISAGLLFLLFALPLRPLSFSVVLACFAFEIGFFKLPLEAEIQKRLRGTALNTALAYLNQVSFTFILAASGIYAAVSALWGQRAFLLFNALLMLAASVFYATAKRK
ncbi:MAG: MFS transporter [Victivallaceae bacterium]|nr:MFS transporter [Victivallaceae bacterium]